MEAVRGAFVWGWGGVGCGWQVHALGPQRICVCVQHGLYTHPNAALAPHGSWPPRPPHPCSQTNTVDNDGRTILHEAASGGHLRAVQYILKLKDLWHSQQDYRGGTALHEAVTLGHMDVVKQLLFIGCDPNTQDSDGCVVVVGSRGGLMMCSTGVRRVAGWWG